jgi:hypothetical protein
MFSRWNFFLIVPSPQAIGVYTFLGVWARKEIKSMKITLAVVAAIWTFIAFLIVVAMALNHNKLIAPSPVGPLTSLKLTSC